MSKKLMMNNYSSDGFKWDIDKKSDAPVSIKELCSEYVDSAGNVSLNKFSNNHVLEVDIESVQFSTNTNEPRIQLLCNNIGLGGHIYWNRGNSVIIANSGYYSVTPTYPCTFKVTLIDNIFTFYIDDMLIKKVSTYSSAYNIVTGIRLQAQNIDILTTGFRYKNFEEGE